MKFIQSVSQWVVIGFAVAAGYVAVGANPQAAAHDGHDHSVEVAATETSQDKKTAVYSYTAQAGDSYTQLVRKAAQTYGLKYDVDLGAARIVAIETQASQQAGWPTLTQGEVVSFDESLVKTWVNAAMDLSDADIAAWQTYVPYIDFDTRNIGE